jgi:hypothetical protein
MVGNRPICLRISSSVESISLECSEFLLRTQYDSQGLLKDAQVFSKSLSDQAMGNIGSENPPKD